MWSTQSTDQHPCSITCSQQVRDYVLISATELVVVAVIAGLSCIHATASCFFKCVSTVVPWL